MKEITVPNGRHVWCKHYTGMSDHKCAKGVEYDNVLSTEEFMLSRNGRAKIKQSRSWPCFKHLVPVCGECPVAEYPTDEEVLQKAKGGEEFSRKINKARAAIMAHYESTKITQGKIQCPCCNATTLNYSIAGNGHVHARCMTDGCVKWME